MDCHCGLRQHALSTRENNVSATQSFTARCYCHTESGDLAQRELSTGVSFTLMWNLMFLTVSPHDTQSNFNWPILIACAFLVCSTLREMCPSSWTVDSHWNIDSQTPLWHSQVCKQMQKQNNCFTESSSCGHTEDDRWKQSKSCNNTKDVLIWEVWIVDKSPLLGTDTYKMCID